jgi:TATA-binding protein-associated factor Taf7
MPVSVGGEDGDDDDARGVCTIVPHELESVEEEDEEQIARQEQRHEHKRQQEEEGEEDEDEDEDEEGQRRRVELARPQPTSLGLTAHHLPLERRRRAPSTPEPA